MSTEKPHKANRPDGDMTWDEARKWLALGIAILAVVGILVLIGALWVNRMDPVLTAMATRNFVVIIGLPFSAIVAFIVVTFFRQNETPMTIKLFGLELSGSSGETFMWLVIFAVTSLLVNNFWIKD
jgi:hypothetical protein